MAVGKTQLVRLLQNKFPSLSRRDASAMVDVISTAYAEALVQGDSIIIPGIGSVKTKITNRKIVAAKGKSMSARRVSTSFRPSETFLDLLDKDSSVEAKLEDFAKMLG